MHESSQAAMHRIAAAVCESMNQSRESRAYDDTEVIAEFDGHSVKTFRHLIKSLPTLPSQIRRHTVLTLGRLRCRSAAHAIFQLILNEDEVASAAAVSLSYIAGHNHVQRALRELSKAGPQFVRYAIVEFLTFCDEVSAEQRVAFLNMCISIALDQREGHSLRSRTLEALAVRSYQLDKRTRLARCIPGVLAKLAVDPSREVRASAVYALRVLRRVG